MNHPLFDLLAYYPGAYEPGNSETNTGGSPSTLAEVVDIFLDAW